jgi:hypothetical protein
MQQEAQQRQSRVRVPRGLGITVDSGNQNNTISNTKGQATAILPT